MAGLLNNILGYLKLSDDEDYDDYMSEFDEEEEEEEEVVRPARNSRNARRTQEVSAVSSERRPMRERANYSSRSTEIEEENVVPRRMTRSERNTGSKVVPMRTVSKGGMEVCIVKPAAFEDAQDVCNIILSGRAAVVNLEGFDADEAQRIMDFISGCIFAVNGKLHRISKFIFIFSPENVDISGDYMDLISENSNNSSLTINSGF